MKNSRLFLVSISIFIYGCATAPIQTPPPPPEKFDFNSFVLKHIGEKTIVTKPPACATWLHFLRGIVKAESNWRNDAVFTEKFIDGATGKRAESVGLFQLSIGDRLNYKTNFCSRISAASLRDPEVNTGCALEIIETLLKRDRSLGAYWSTVRDGKIKCDN